MKTLICSLRLVFLIGLCFIFVATSVQLLGQPKQKISAFKNLLGTWEMKTKKDTIYENWTCLDKSTYQGKSFKIQENDTVQLESIELVLQEKNIYYIPTVPNQNKGQAVPFQLISSKNKEFISESKEHDFPQRIIYKFLSKDVLNTRIEGISKGKEAKSEYNYKRIR